MNAHLGYGLSVVIAVTGCGDVGVTPSDGGTADAGTALDAPWTPPDPPDPPPSEPGRHDVEVIDTRRIVPDDGLPAEAVTQQANNNLDVIRHDDGRVYLAFRTAPQHFASPDVVMHVVSSTDEETWRYETSFALGHDLREPRFLSLDGELFLYVAHLGTSPTSFSPMGTSYSRLEDDGTWTDLAPLGEFGDGSWIVWRTKIERGTPYMIVYEGGENIYEIDSEPVSVHLLTTADGLAWEPVNPDRRVVLSGGTSETAFTLADDGTLFAVARNEAGDEEGWGSKVCRAPASDITDWTCRNDPKKYDSPLMLWHDGEAYLIGRRNVTETGNYDLMTGRGDHANQTFENQIDYIAQPKRCSLWRYVQDEDRIAYILDLPSKGDTCFPGVIAGDSPDELVVYNYSSPIDGEDVAWNVGQTGPTNIYRHVLRFTPR